MKKQLKTSKRSTFATITKSSSALEYILSFGRTIWDALSTEENPFQLRSFQTIGFLFKVFGGKYNTNIQKNKKKAQNGTKSCFNQIQKNILGNKHLLNEKKVLGVTISQVFSGPE